MDNDFSPDYGLHLFEEYGNKIIFKYDNALISKIQHIGDDLFTIPLVVQKDKDYIAYFFFSEERLRELLMLFPNAKFIACALTALTKKYKGRNSTLFIEDPIRVNIESLLGEPQTIDEYTIVPFNVQKFWEVSVNKKALIMLSLTGTSKT